MNESALVNAAIRYLWLCGCFVWRNNTGAYRKPDGHMVRFGAKGSSDVLGVAPDGRFLAIECKVGRNTPTEHQTHFLAEVRARGGIALVVRPDDYSDLIDQALCAADPVGDVRPRPRGAQKDVR
jgi:hypothetical protein